MNELLPRFEHWKAWLEEKASELRAAGFNAEIRSGGPMTPKPCCSFRHTNGVVLGQFDLWSTGEADVDIMDAGSGQFIHREWGMRLGDLTLEIVFSEFLARVGAKRLKWIRANYITLEQTDPKVSN